MSLVFVVFMGIHYCFCFHGCAYASIHNQVLANIGKEPMKKEVRREFCPSLYQKMSLYFYRQLHFQLSQGLDQIAQAAKCLNRFSSSSQVQDSKQGSLKAPLRKKLLLPDSCKTQRMRKRTQMTKLSGLFLPAVCPLP